MTVNEVKQMKQRINTTLSKRNGIGDVSAYAGKDYDLPDMEDGKPISHKVGENTIDLLLEVTGDFPELGNGSASGGAIPEGFNVNDINRICDELDKDADSANRGGFSGYGYDGRYYDLPGGTKPEESQKRTESNHCGGACTGLCVGSCVGACNGCTGCSEVCSSSCSGTSAANTTYNNGITGGLHHAGKE